MATGRSGQLVVSGAKDTLSSSSSSSSSRGQYPSRGSPHTDTAYFLQRRFQDTALVIFQQHAQRLREVSPGYYTPLPSTSPTPSIRVLPGIGPAPSAAGGSPHPDSPPPPSSSSFPSPSSPSFDQVSTVSGGNSHPRSGASPPSSASVKGTSFHNGSESSLEKTPERSRRWAPEENGAFSDRVLAAEGGFSPGCTAQDAASFSDSSSSVGSSEPDSDLEERFPAAVVVVPSVSAVSVVEGAEVVGHSEEEEEGEEKSVDRDRGEISPARGDLRAEEGAPVNGQGERIQLLQSQGIGAIPHPPVESRAPVAGDPSPGSGLPSSPQDLPRVGEPPSFREPSLSCGEPQSSPEPFPRHHSCGEAGADLSASSEEEVQITRL